MAKISIILPLYNADLRCLRDCVQSIRAQTLEDFECIFVNDGSPTSECVEYARQYAKTDARFLLVEKANGGLSTARNFGVRYATAKYVTFIDQDDILHPQRFEAAVQLLNETGADVCECTVARPTFEFSYEAARFETYDLEAIRRNAVVLCGQDILSWYLAQKMNITVWSHVYKRDMLLGYPLPEHIWGSDDLAYSLESCDKIASLVRIAEVMYFWRKNPNATTGRVPFAFVNGVKQAVFDVVEYYRNRELPLVNRNALNAYLADAFIVSLRDTLCVDRPDGEQGKIIDVVRAVNGQIEGGLASCATEEDSCWVKRIINGDFQGSVKGARLSARKARRIARWIALKRKVKKIIGRE